MREIFKNFTFIFFLLSSNIIFSFGWNQEIKENDSINVEKYINHIKTLNYISRKNASNPYFLDLAYKYSDSILLIESNNEFALNTKINIDLTRSTIENNVVNKFNLFEFYSGIPNYYGFVDDPIEYAYDEAIEKLINTRYIKLHNGPLSDGNITSILIRENCGDEMFEIVNQTLVLNTNHHILQKDELIEVFGKEKTNQIINGNFDKSEIEKLTKELKLERLGIFKVNDLDIVNNEIWFVQIDFSTFIDNEFTEAIFEKGVSIDKRDINFLNLVGILFLNLFLAFYLYLILSNTQFAFSSDNKRNLFNKLVFSFLKGLGRASGQILAANYLFWKSIFPILPNIKSFINTFGDGFNLAIRWLQYLITPIILSSLMIFATSFVVPNPEEHFLELNVIVWFISSILLISFFPLIINLFIVNRLSIDGFHTKYGYQDFIAISLFATQIPFIIFYYIKFGLPDYSGVLFEGNGGYFELTLNSFLLSIIIGNAFYEYSSKRKSKFDNKQALVGLGIGIVATIYVNGLLVMGVGGDSMLIYGTPILIICLVINNFLEKNYLRKERENLIRFENKSNDKWGFVEKVINVKNKIFNSIVSDKNNALNLYIINANQGIGKTRALNEVKKEFNKNGWLWFYGDCDEIQSESSVAFEPILQAFGSLLNKEKLSDRSEEIDTITSKIVNTALDSTVGINLISEFKNNSESSIKNICLEITEKLNSLNQKIVIAIEDLHWIDSDSFSFLKELIKTVNRYDTLRKNIIFILTLRSNFNNDRGINYKKLINEINQLNEETENQVSYKDLISNKDFIINDFLLELYNLNDDLANSIQLSKSSVDELNKIFNKLISINLDKDLNVTPLYILNNIKKWIDNGTLKLSQDGYILSKSIQIDEMPNFDQIDSFYHDIFDSFDKKWIRLLESATIIGNKFDADVLSQVWEYNLLEVLAFLEEAVEKELVVDLSEEDNFYEFKDQRIVSAIKSYFKNDLIQFRGEKQIIIEYNKRYLFLVKDIIDKPEKFDIEEVVKVTKRIISLRFLEKYSLKLDKLILDIVLRYLYYKQIEKLKVFGKYLTEQDVETIGNLIIDVSVISDSFEATNEIKKEIVNRVKDDIKNFNKISLEKNQDYKCIHDLKLIILLQSIYGQIKEINVDYGFKDLDWSSFQYEYLTKILISKLNGLSLLFYLNKHYIKLKNLTVFDTSVEFGKKDAWYIYNAKTINEIDLKINEIKKEFINCNKYKNIEIEHELFKLRKEIFSSKSFRKDGHMVFVDKSLNSYALDEFLSEEESDEHIKPIFNFPDKRIEEVEIDKKLAKEINLSLILQNKKKRYDTLFEIIIESDNLLLLDICLRDFISFAILELEDDELAIEYFRKYHEKMVKNNNINELWINRFLQFLNTLSIDLDKHHGDHGLSLISDPKSDLTFTLNKNITENSEGKLGVGILYMIEYTEEVDIKFKEAEVYLSKVIESSTLSDISQLFLDQRKNFIVRFRISDLNKLIHDFKFKLVRTYSNTHKYYTNFLKEIANDLALNNLFNESNKELFELIEIRKKFFAKNKRLSLNQSQNLDIRNVLYQISRNYLKLGDLQQSLNYILKSINEHSNKFKEWEDNASKGYESFGWKLEKNKLIPNGNKKEELYVFGGEMKPLLIKWASLYLQLARIYSLKKEYLKSNEAFNDSLIYIFEKVLHIDYNLIQLEKGINMYKFNKSESIKIIKEAIKKLDKKSIPKEQIKMWNSNEEYINSILERGKEIINK